MTNYVKSTNFTVKDSLPTGDTNKVIRGSEFDTEFDAIQTAVGTKADLAGPIFTGTATFDNLSDGTITVTAFVDEDNMSSNSATLIPTQQSVKAYVDSQIALVDTLAELTDTNITTPADGALLFYDTTTSKWIDNVVSGDITIADTGVAAIGSGVIVNADVNASAAIDVSKTALTAGTGLTLTTNTLSVDAAQTQITSVGTLSSLSVSGALTLGGTAITSTAAELNILDGVTATTAELNILDGVTSTTSELNVLDGVTAFLDEDDMTSDSATALASQQSIKAYVDSQVGGSTTLSGLTDTNVTTPADGALLFYDTATSMWIDNVVSGDITIADTGVAAIGSGVIVNADISASAAIDISKLNGVTSTAAELNILDGVTATTAELNYVDGVTSNIQTQLDSKAGTGKAIAMAIVFG